MRHARVVERRHGAGGRLQERIESDEQGAKGVELRLTGGRRGPRPAGGDGDGDE